MSKEKDLLDKTITRLQKDWKQLDDLEVTPTLTTEALKEQLVIAKAEKRKAFHKELSLFILMALLILTALTTAIFQAPLIFIGTQVFALTVAPIIFLFLTKRKSEGSILS
ncbi:YxlC family protein [Sutcliffiella halmapala]|uniref:YxlC family protein n=1 Tax=Sutcliffiella halmapala TaxID=79882 RepID=UPI0009957B41|nr:YxlC family protein [Sutcliffiella halmapala]